jgi:hypothetical protein
MNDPADSANPSGPTRIAALGTAVVDLIDDIATNPNHDKIYLGIDVFRLNASWMNATNNTALVPTNDQTRLKSAVLAGFGSTVQGSTACTTSSLFGNTNVGMGYSFATDYYKSNRPTDNVKRVEIVITDGGTNSSIPNAACPVSIFCPYFKSDCSNPIPLSYGWTCNESAMNPPANPCVPDPTGDTGCPQCIKYGNEFLECTVADTDTSYISKLDNNSHPGSRNPDVDAYAVTILKDSELSSTIKNLFGNPDYIKLWYNSDNANNISGFLNNIYTDVTQQSGSIFIKRIIN